MAIALLISTVFLIVEVAGAALTNSLALMADAGHMLTDVAALGLSPLRNLAGTTSTDAGSVLRIRAGGGAGGAGECRDAGRHSAVYLPGSVPADR